MLILTYRRSCLVRKRTVRYVFAWIIYGILVVIAFAWPRESSRDGILAGSLDQLQGETNNTALVERGVPLAWQRTWRESLSASAGVDEHTKIYIDSLLLNGVVWIGIGAVTGLAVGLGRRNAYTRD